ncbi:MAG: M48 family metalloprotease [Bdellovibrionota bacterium]|nr:M48 family metalloprotease [Bdellovibrionota bacterium]
MNKSYVAWTILGAFSLIIMYIGKELGGRQGLLAAFILAIVSNSLVYFYGDIRLKSLFHSKPIQGQDPYQLENLVTELANRLHMHAPEIFICDLNTPTAFSTSKSGSSASILVSRPLLEKLDRDELESVIAFEMLKIKNHYTFTATLCSAIVAGTLKPAEAIDYLISFGKPFKEELGPVTGLVAPLSAWLVRRMQSKSAIFQLDQLTSDLTAKPKALAKSLWKLESLVATNPQLVPKDTAHIFFMNPLPKYGWSGMFQSQPTARERIEKLIGQYPI